MLSESSPAAVWAQEKDKPRSGFERILSGSYDGLLRVWNGDSELLASSPSAVNGGHTAAVKAVKFLSASRLVSAGNDRIIRIWEYSDIGGASGSRISPVLELFGHKSSVDALAVHGPSSRVLSGSTDNTIGIWSTKKADAPAAPGYLLPSALLNNKRRKLGNPSHPIPQRGLLQQLSGHTNPVSGVIFASTDPTIAYSSSLDHTVRTWDLLTGASVDSRSTAHPLLSLCAMSSVNLLAAGSSARHIIMVDPRTSATNVAAMTLRGHTNAVVSLSADPASAYGIVSGSHDGTCRVWDIRSVRSGAGVGVEAGGQVGDCVYVIDRETWKSDEKRRPVAGDRSKVFDVVWDQNVGIVSASEDKRVQINRSNR